MSEATPKTINALLLEQEQIIIRTGEKLSKLTESDVLEIRRIYSPGKLNGSHNPNSCYGLGKRYGVGHTLIFKIIKREAWQHI